MRSLGNLIANVNRPGISRWLIGTATLLLTLWLQVHIALAALHDDGGTLRNAIGVYNSAEVRSQLGWALDSVFDSGAALSGSGAAVDAIRVPLTAALASGQLTSEATDAIVTVVLATRDDALAQFASDAPARALTLQVGPLLTGFSIALPPEVAAQFGVADPTQITVPVIDAASVETLRTRYHWAVLLDRWGLLVAGACWVVGTVLAPRPLRTLAIGFGIVGASALIALPLFSVVQGWLVGGGAGPWSPLVAPLLENAFAEVTPWLIPLGVAGLVLGAGLGVTLVVLRRRGVHVWGEPRPPRVTERVERRDQEPDAADLGTDQTDPAPSPA